MVYSFLDKAVEPCVYTGSSVQPVDDSLKCRIRRPRHLVWRRTARSHKSSPWWLIHESFLRALLQTGYGRSAYWQYTGLGFGFRTAIVIVCVYSVTIVGL